MKHEVRKCLFTHLLADSKNIRWTIDDLRNINVSRNLNNKLAELKYLSFAIERFNNIVWYSFNDSTLCPKLFTKEDSYMLC